MKSPHRLNALMPSRQGLYRVLKHILLSLTLAALIMLPDHIYQLFQPGYQTRFSPPTFTILSLLTFLALASQRRFYLGFIVLFALLQLSELLHFSYFGTLISPHAVGLLFSETDEIVETLGSIIPKIALPVTLITAEIILATVLFQHTRRHQLRLRFAWIPVLLLLTILPAKANNPSSVAQQFYPNPREYAITNSLYSVSYFIGKDLPDMLNGEDSLNMACRPYTTTRSGLPEVDNLIIVMGESLGTEHMGLYGYQRNTTPRLQTLTGDAGFFYTTALSASISTKVTLPMFFNVQREPGNINHLSSYVSNLFKLAKQQHFQTHYFSAQTANLATFVGARYIDDFQTKENFSARQLQKKDRVLLDKLHALDLSQKNLLVLHQRNSHSPYEHNYPPQYAFYPEDPEDFTRHMINTYDNSIHFTDQLLFDMIRYLQQHARGRTLLLFTSDHAELLGLNGKFGHTHLQKETSLVPLIAYGSGLDTPIMNTLRGMHYPTHYEIGKLIATLLGYRIDNPNEIPGIYYLNGHDIGGRAGYLAIDKNRPGLDYLSPEEHDDFPTPCPTGSDDDTSTPVAHLQGGS